MTTHIEQAEALAEALATAEHLAVQVLEGQLSPGCSYTKLLAGSTKRGPASLYACADCGAVTVVSVPAGGLRVRDPHDPTSRTRLATFPLSALVIETGAFIESDGTVRGLLTLHLPGHPEPEWEITVDGAVAVGEAIRGLRGLPGRC